MGDMTNDVGSIIRAKRKENGLTQKELANKAGFATETIQQYELGKREPSFARLVTIATILDEPVHTFCPELATNKTHTIGRRIQLARKHRGLTQQGLADKIGKSCSQVQKYECGTTEISLTVLQDIADALDVNYGELLNGRADLYLLNALTDIINDEIAKADEMLANLTADDDIFAIRYHKLCCQDMLNKVKEISLKG